MRRWVASRPGGIGAIGFHPMIIRTHRLACSLSSIGGKCRRNSTTAPRKRTERRLGVVLLWRDHRSSPLLSFASVMDVPCRIMVLSAVGVCRRMMASEAVAS